MARYQEPSDPFVPRYAEKIVLYAVILLIIFILLAYVL